MNFPNMKSKMKGRELVLLSTFYINGKYVLGVYQGFNSKLDIILRYRQRDLDSRTGWSRIRTPKHIHWAVDVLLKMNADEGKTKEFLEFLIDLWNNTITPFKTKKERDMFLAINNLSRQVDSEAANYSELANKGEYSIKFLLLIARLLMVQEKTNLESAYMFKKLLEALHEGQDIFKIVSIATHR
jgi:hypothetical protein